MAALPSYPFDFEPVSTDPKRPDASPKLSLEYRLNDQIQMCDAASFWRVRWDEVLDAPPIQVHKFVSFAVLYFFRNRVM